MNAPAITVLLPVHNGAEHLRVALDSVFAQDFTDFELLVVDDGSTDATAAILDGYDDPRLRVLRLQRIGLIGTLNRGLDEARGDFVARLDADDEMLPGRLRRQLAAFRRDPELVACGSDYLLFGAADGLVRTPRNDRDCRAHLVFGSPIAHPAVMLRVSALRAGGIRYRKEYPHAEDFRLFSEIANVGTLTNLTEPGLRYRVHPGQVSQMQAGPQREMHLRICAENLAVRGVTVTIGQLDGLLWPPGHGVPVAISYLARRLPVLLALGLCTYGVAGLGQAWSIACERLRRLLGRRA